MAAAVLFQQKISTIVHALDRRQVINDQLESPSYWYLRWIGLSLLQPFCRRLHRDAFLHYRADALARRILEECRGQAEISFDSFRQIQTQIFERLDRKTGGKYHAAFTKAGEDLEILYFQKAPCSAPLKAQLLSSFHHAPESHRRSLNGIGGQWKEQDAPVSFRSTNTDPFKWSWPEGIVAGPLREAVDNFLKTLKPGPVWLYKTILARQPFHHLEETWTLPVDLIFLSDPQKRPFRILAATAEACIDLTAARICEKKEAQPEEAKAVAHLSLKTKIGAPRVSAVIEQTVLFPESPHPHQRKPRDEYHTWIEGEAITAPNKKYFLLQERFPSSLEKIIGTPALNELSVQLHLLDQLISCVDTLHGLESFHQAIRISNIGARPAGRFFQIALQGFKHSNCSNEIVLSSWEPPEIAKFFSSDDSALILKVQEFQREGAQPRDMWFAGIVFTQVLRNSPEPLEAVDPSIQAAPGPNQYLLRMVWDLVSQMLQRDPAKRITARKAKELWDEILQNGLWEKI